MVYINGIFHMPICFNLLKAVYICAADTAAPIIDVDAIAVDETSITVSWSKPEGVVDKYILTCDDIETIVTTTNGSCTNLTSGDTYNVIVCSSLNGSEPMENCSTPESVTTGEDTRVH